jgi:acid phosphatase family membrane protein YuiD
MIHCHQIKLSLIVFLCLSPSLAAQSLTGLPAVVLKDEARIWTSPLHIHASDSGWLIPFAAGAALFLGTDHTVNEEVHESPGLLSPSRKISNLGGAPALAIESAGLYGIGKLTHHSHAATTGLLAGQAAIHSTLVAEGLKVAFNRERPDKATGNGYFWEGGKSFPSGHAMATWAFATVVAHEYPHKPLIGIGAYGVATAVSLARIGGLDHHPSDVFVGAAIGSLIGEFVLHHHGTH